jgi:uncharacterized protein YbaA (DUF1428 family)
MTYIDGFVAAVPQASKQAYLNHVREALALDRVTLEGGARRVQPDKATMPFDGQRLIYGGFATMLDA